MYYYHMCTCQEYMKVYMYKHKYVFGYMHTRVCCVMYPCMHMMEAHVGIHVYKCECTYAYLRYVWMSIHVCRH